MECKTNSGNFEKEKFYSRESMRIFNYFKQRSKKIFIFDRLSKSTSSGIRLTASNKFDIENSPYIAIEK